MNPYLRNPKLKPGRFRIGNRVRVPFGVDHIEGEIVEDWGHIGAGGKRIYYVRIQPDQWNEMLVPRSEDELEAIAD